MLEKLKKNPQSLSQWLNSLDLEQTRAGVQQESRARIVLLGLAGAGKSSLFNRLCGWTVSPPQITDEDKSRPDSLPGEPLEDFGLFCLVDLPPDLGHHSRPSLLDLSQPEYFPYGISGNGPDLNLGLGGTIPLGAPDPLTLAEGANLLVYVLDGTVGVQSADYRWIGRLRRLGVPLLVVLNKSDLLEVDLTRRQREIEARLGTNVLPVSALAGTNLSDELLPKMINLCPNLTVALGRELGGFRPLAAERLIRQAALINGLVALEPLPLIDLPVQIVNLAGLMLRLATLYDRPANDVRRREVVVALAGGLAGRYAAQQLAKLVPVVGWLASSFIGWSCTWGLGRAAVAYFEADGDAAVDRSWGRAKTMAIQVCQAAYRRWQQRPRLAVKMSRNDSD